MKKKIIYSGLWLIAVILFLFPLGAYAATRVGYYTLTVPANTATTMGDASVTIPITVNNLNTSNPGASIAFVRLDFNAALYYVSLANTAPAGWVISEIKNAGAGQTYITYTTTTNAIPRGGSQTFYVLQTGAGNNNIPSAVSDMTDAFVDGSNTTVLTVNAVNSNYFDRNGTGNADMWQRKSLSASLTATPLTVSGGGMITIIMTVTNRSSAAQTFVIPTNAALTVNGTGTAIGSLISGPNPASTASLAAGSSAIYQWVYAANGSGSLQFCNSARDGTGTATSLTDCSNTVAVGNFTSIISVAPTQIVSGQNVTVTMTVTNNGLTSVQGISPTLTPSAGSTYIAGPKPASVGSLAPGASSAFQWTYRITGAVGSSFIFTGYATDNNGVTSSPNPAVSNPVKISSYSVNVSPTIVASGSTNVAFTFQVINNGGYGLQQVLITPPSAGFVYSTASGGCAAPTWTVSTGGAPTWTNFLTAADYIPATGGVCSFIVTYASVPTVAVNTDFNFRIDVWDTQTPTNKEPRASIGVIIKITKYVITLTASPASINPNCPSTITATVTPAPANGSILNFQETAGTLGPHTAGTTGGVAQTVLLAPDPYDPSVPGATITTTFQDALASIVVNFTNGLVCSSSIRILDWREVVK